MYRRFLFPLVMTLATSVHADPKIDSKKVIMDPAALPESVKADGGKRFDAGMKALQEREFERAYHEFRAAFVVVPSLATLGNLGLAELETQRYVDAATHLRDVIRLERQRAREAPQFMLDGYKRALEKVGRLKLIVQPSDATVRVDGAPLEETGAEEEWFGAPGEHRVRVERHGFLPFERMTLLQAGAVTTVEATLEPAGKSTPRLSSTSESKAPPRATAVRRISGEDESTEDPPPGLSTKTIVVGTGAAVTLTAGIVAAIYAVKAGNAEGRIEAETRRLEPSDSSYACGTRGCPALERAFDDRYSSGERASVALNVTIAAGLATAATFLLWPGEKRHRVTASCREPRLRVHPAGVSLEMSLP